MPTLARASTVFLLALPLWPAAAQQGAPASPPAAAAPARPPGASATPAPGAGLPAAADQKKSGPAGRVTPKAAEKAKVDDKKAAEKLKAPIATRREESLADCMKYWDKGTHMTKAEWRATCVRQLASEKKARSEIERQAAAAKAADVRAARGKAKRKE